VAIILDEIVANKRLELAEQQQTVPLAQLEKAALARPAPLDFGAALQGSPGEVRLIAEIKRASPSKGPLRPDLDPRALARLYVENGAAAISVLTERRYFRGSGEDLRAVKAEISRPEAGPPGIATEETIVGSWCLECRQDAGGPGRTDSSAACVAAANHTWSSSTRDRAGVPVLRKDFIFDPYQVVESRAWGADALLLITAILPPDQLRALLGLTHQLGMKALVETHDAAEVQMAISADAKVIGINNRDLRSFAVDLATTEKLRHLIPADRLVVSESGISAREDVDRLRQCGVHAVLVGEALVKAGDVGVRTRELLSGNAGPYHAGPGHQLSPR